MAAQDSHLVSEEEIAARIERLPLAGWYARTMLIVGQAGFFDSFDALTITFVLPVLAGLWTLSPQDIGWLVSAGYLGQWIGAIWLGALAERHGRLKIIRLAAVIMGVFSIACALSSDYSALLGFRFLQGIGLGAEVPVAAAYMNELTRAEYRGRLVMLFQMIFASGILAASLLSIWVVPHFGWQAMFYIGAAPAFLGFSLLLLVPESPRWLAAHGREKEADRVLSGIEARASAAAGKALPPLGPDIPKIHREKVNFASLFRGGYGARTLTLWLLAFLISTVGYGLNVWMPTLYRTVYHLPLQETLVFSLSLAVAGMGGALFGWFFIDRFGRRPTFLISFLGSGFCLLTLWALGASTILVVMLLTALALFFISIMLAGLYVYFPENYPTRMRALGTGVATSWMRVSSIIMPIVVGQLLSHSGAGAVYLMFGGTAILGAGVVFFRVIETSGRVLEDIAA